MESEKMKKGRPLMEDIVAPWPELLRLESGQSKLAGKLGVAQTTVGKWARGTHRIPELARRELLRLCIKHGLKEGVSRFEGL